MAMGQILDVIQIISSEVYASILLMVPAQVNLKDSLLEIAKIVV